MSREQLGYRHTAGHRAVQQAAAAWGRNVTRRGAIISVACVAALLSGLLAAPAPAQQRADGGDWIGTWTASPQPVWDADFFARSASRARSATRRCGR